ncbi:MAG: spore coat associated protein CotJA [Deltaproteobacteria bacterium]
MYNKFDPQSQFVPTTIPIPQYKYTPYATAYVLFQTNADKMYALEEGFDKGTIFPDLYIPYTRERNERRLQ